MGVPGLILYIVFGLTHLLHDFYGNFQKNASVVSPNFYNFTGVFIKVHFEEGIDCKLSNTLPALNPSNDLSQASGTVLFISTEDLLANKCKGFSGVINQLEDFILTVANSQLPPLNVALFSSSGPQEVEFGGPREPYGGKITSPPNIHLAIVSKNVGAMLLQQTGGPVPYIALITQGMNRSRPMECGKYVLSACFASLVAFCAASLVSLAIRGQSKGILVMTRIAWLIGYSAYSAVQLKWGQIISKLFPNTIFISSFYFIVFVMINYLVITVMNIAGIMIISERLDSALVYINAIYLPLLMSFQALLFFYYAMMYKRGMQAFPVTSRTRVSLQKLALLLIFAVLGFVFEAVSQFLQNGGFVTSITGNILILTFNTLSQLALFSPVFAILSIRGTDDTATYAAVLHRNRNGSSMSTPRHASTTHSNKTEHNRPQSHPLAVAHTNTHMHTQSYPQSPSVYADRYDLGHPSEEAYSPSRSVSISLDLLNSRRVSRTEEISTIITPLTPPPPRRREKSKSQISTLQLLTENTSEKPELPAEATTSMSGDTESHRISFLENNSDS
ncbi:hypothetical protein K493DRAFT_339066 [Basidiobolus meristosporus CBS 931.73]|uniref:G-protein coupled receptors family 3 profile domain-containing protein n=1 Tax=Basidiobolus meristosporus CBS 931.73 TaxID=1314790 RepID=A0A1Y1Y253_9FUNG|nr:hypothetical protein K493DRAFT_339066 [Basidiobolus meristosporus CBS 931.73]|eukprot:ORX91955.1 hypothetical protein K493DRAFT_339066 [Basidiobolus meristosporus CBS 931.73]